MPLQVRTGTAAQRLATNTPPLSGEPWFTYDDGQLYVGDGVTPGGVNVGSNVSLESLSNVTTINEFTGIIQYYSITSNVLTISLTLNHNYYQGMSVVISNSNAGLLNGTYTILSIVDSNRFTVSKTNANVAQTAANGLVVPRISDGDSLIWDQANGYWENGTPSITLNDLSDVDTATIIPVNGQTLIYNSATWAPGTIAPPVTYTRFDYWYGSTPPETAIQSYSITSNVATITLPTNHPYTNGQSITISNASPSLLNGTHSIGTYSPSGEWDKTFAISTASVTSNVVTITLSSTHNYSAGQRVVIAGNATTLNGTYVIATIPGNTRFTYSKTHADVAESQFTGTAKRVANQFTINLTSADTAETNATGTVRASSTKWGAIGRFDEVTFANRGFVTYGPTSSSHNPTLSGIVFNYTTSKFTGFTAGVYQISTSLNAYINDPAITTGTIRTTLFRANNSSTLEAYSMDYASYPVLPYASYGSALSMFEQSKLVTVKMESATPNFNSFDVQFGYNNVPSPAFWVWNGRVEFTKIA